MQPKSNWRKPLIPEPTLPQTSSQEGIGVPLFPQFTIPYPSTLTSLFSTFASPLGLVLPVSISLSSTNTADSDGTNATTWMTSVTAKPDEACPIIVNVRPAIPEDCDGICARIYELARSLGFPRGPSITPERLRLDAFPASRRDAPVVFAHVAQEMKSSKIVAYALYHFLYSSWEGKSMLLEDIYVEPGYRQSDIGKRLFANVCKCTLEKGCDELKLNVFRDKSGGKVFQESVNVSDKKEGNEKDENEGLVHGKLGKKVLEMLARSADANEIETKEGQL
ncbi:diamine acetyltransferase 1-like isoform X2 [Paramacrobiotus metropolitanus]|uniref:diamine acetyltransferase 1-like isoform X2 n=1 Tax=Paramacrobiotus metropolitanus TaxID=2943436 RepID=UPI00244617C6|nr:diamine acetyltransferase 1-like isoform X2 [Paramacrobiotus metropolitanus]